MSKVQHLCVAFIADSDQYREEEYHDILRMISEYNEENNSNVFIHWQIYCGNVHLEELNDKHVIVVFTSENMAKCLDEGNTQTMKIRLKNCIERFQLNGGELRRYLSREENFRKVIVVESEGCEVRFLSDVPLDKTFDGSDIDAEEFIGKITTRST